MKRLRLWLSVAVLLGVPLALGTAVYLCFQDQPLVHRTTEFKPDDVERAVRLIQKHDPRRMKSGTLRTLSMRGEDLNLVVNYFANRHGKGSSRIALQPGGLTLAASVEIPASPFGRYLNVQAVLRETAGLPAFDQLRIGRLPAHDAARFAAAAASASATSPPIVPAPCSAKSRRARPTARSGCSSASPPALGNPT